jgi:hypothetical protein
LVESSFDLYKAQTYLKVAKEESNSQPKVDAEKFRMLEKTLRKSG